MSANTPDRAALAKAVAVATLEALVTHQHGRAADGYHAIIAAVERILEPNLDALCAAVRRETVARCVEAVEGLDEYGVEEPVFGGTITTIDRDDALDAIRRAGEGEP